MPEEKGRCRGGKAFFRLVEGKLEEEAERGSWRKGGKCRRTGQNAARKRVSRRRMHVSTAASRCDYSQSALNSKRTE